MDVTERLRQMRESANLRQEDLAERLGKSVMWVSRRETGETRALHPDDLAEWAEACGFVFDYAFERPGRRVVRSGHDGDAIAAAERLLEIWPRMTKDEQRLLLNQLRWIEGGRP